MSDSVLTIEQASRLVREIEKNPAFAQRYQEKPAAAMLELGIPATTIANLPAACLARCTLNLKNVEDTLRTIEKNALVTFRHAEMRSVAEVWQRASSRAGFLAHGPVYALQAILAAQADHYIDEVELIQRELHALESVVFADRQPPGFERKVFAVKRDIAHLRGILGSQRELVHRIGRGDFAVVPKRMWPLFRDVYDHLYRATEMLDTLRDLSIALLETHLAIVANRTNHVMRVLTTVATFILPLSLVTGWFGMNFQRLDGLEMAHPDLFVLSVFAAVMLLMGVLLKRGGWM